MGWLEARSTVDYSRGDGSSSSSSSRLEECSRWCFRTALHTLEIVIMALLLCLGQAVGVLQAPPVLAPRRVCSFRFCIMSLMALH